MLKKLLRIGLALSTLGVGLGIYMVFIEPDRLSVQEYRICPKGTKPYSGMRIAILSDIHVGAPHIKREKLKQIVAMTNEAKPDLVLMPGDFMATGVVGWRHVAPSVLAAELKHLSAPMGSYAILGNHDWDYGAHEVMDAFKRHGIKLIENDSVRVTYEDRPLFIAGVGDTTTLNDKTDQAFKDIPRWADVLLLTHSPDLFAKPIDKRVILGVAGHTHGGQVVPPLIGPITTSSQYGRRFDRGLKEEKFFISSGIGTSVLPIRFNMPPEISLLILDCPR